MNYVYYDFHRKNTNMDCERILESYVIEKGYDCSDYPSKCSGKK